MARLLDRTRTRLAFGGRQLLRHLRDLPQRHRFATAQSPHDLPILVREHRLPIYRNFPGVDRSLFDNKRENLRLALRGLDGVLIPPGALFSLWRLVGPPTARRGFREGLVLDRGQPARGVGGGLCQLANALFWLALHAEFGIVERHHHSVDLFPDDHRTVPFGTGATIVYNFKDLRFVNRGPATYQWRVTVTDDALIARLLADRPPLYRYVVGESDHAFVTTPAGLSRRNTIVREQWDARGECLAVETLFHNWAQCRYPRPEGA